MLAVALAGAFAPATGLTQNNPSGGVAIHGQAGFSSPTPTQLNVTTQNGPGTSHSAINWQSFSIPAGSSTNFLQPSAASTVINRVVTNTPSAIFGSLSSNGKVVLVNQSGIAVGAGAMIDTAGFTASALRMTDADALAGRLRFGDAPGSTSAISVEGRITAHNGDVVLVAPNIDVGGSALIQAPNGSTVLAAGQQVEITGRGLEGISMLVQAPTDTVRNLGSLQGSAVGIFAGTLRHSGQIQATTASLEGGKVLLKATGDAYVEGAATILATGSKGGQVDVFGNRLAVMDQASIDVSGSHGGGSIRIGGDYQGSNPDVPNAQITYLGAQTALKANATDSGNGGRVIVWSDGIARAYGSISANALGASGDGGFIETSGHQFLDVAGSRVTASSAGGQAGTWLLDPADISIVPGAAGTPSNMSASTPFEPTSGATTSIITDGTLSQALDSSNVVLTTTNNGSPGGSQGDIIFDPGSTGILIQKTTNTAARILTLNAGHDIFFNTGSGGTTFRDTSAANGNGLTIFLNAGNIVRTDGAVVLDGVNNEVGALVQNGKTWQSIGSVTLNGLSVIRLPNQTSYAAFDNQGILNINSASGWSFLSDPSVQGGIINNSGTVNVNGTNNGNTTAWEAIYNNLAGGTLNIGANKLLSMQNMGSIAGSVVIGGLGELRVSEQHAGGHNFTNTALSGSGRITVNPGVTVGFSNTSGTIGTLNVAGNVNNVAGGLGVQNYLQTTAGSSFSGAGGLFVSGGFNHTAGTFNPSGALNINVSSGNFTFSDALNAASIALSSSSGSLTINSPLTTSGAMSFLASTGITVNAALNAGTTFSAQTVGVSPIMTVNRSIFSSGDMNFDLTGDLLVQAGSGQNVAVSVTGSGTQTITAANYVELRNINASSGSLTVGTASGLQQIQAGGAVVLSAGTGSSTYALINSGGNQTISAAGIALIAGASGANNFAAIRSAGNQAISVSSGGDVSLQGGAGTDGFARIQALGTTQTLAFSSGGNLFLEGGTGASDDFARIQSLNGTQSITGSPNITLTGGATGGADTLGNFADIVANAGNQTIVAGNMTLTAGAAGQENFATIRAPNQNITVHGDLSLTGGGSAASSDGTSGGGARIGGVFTQTPTALVLAVDGDLTLTGGTLARAGSAIGANVVGSQPTDITITVGGDLTLNPGSVAQAGSRIGSPATSPAGGNISITAGGTIALNGASIGDTAIRTLGDISLSADFLSINNLVSGATVYASGSSGVEIGGVGQLAASASGDSIRVVTGSGNFTNTAGPTALRVAQGGRWLLFSNDPALDTLGGLEFNFNQFETTFGDAGSVQGSGNGVVYRVRNPFVEQVDPEGKAQTEVLVTFLDLFGKALEKQVQDDTNKKDKKGEDAIVTEGEVCK